MKGFSHAVFAGFVSLVLVCAFSMSLAVEFPRHGVVGPLLILLIPTVAGAGLHWFIIRRGYSPLWSIVPSSTSAVLCALFAQLLLSAVSRDARLDGAGSVYALMAVLTVSLSSLGAFAISAVFLATTRVVVAIQVHKAKRVC